MRHAVVTGSSSGIGEAIARRLLAGGWRVTGLDRAPPVIGEPAFEPVRVELTDRTARAAALSQLADVTAIVAFIHDQRDQAAAATGGLQRSTGINQFLKLGRDDLPFIIGEGDHLGGHLRADLDGRKHSLASFITRVAEAADEGRSALEARLQDRVREISLDLPVDEAMIAQEIVRTVQRSDISEEVTRFRAHLSHWDALTDGPEPCGRKLDFLLQEMNREVNTIGSKADGLRVSELIINAKAELEKMREQVQNIE